eukprot:175632_1
MCSILTLLLTIRVYGGSCNCTRVLFIGNSYIAWNNLPRIIFNIAASVGDCLEFDSNSVGGATLKDHVINPNSLNLIMKGNWDFVVLQEQSQYLSFPLWQVKKDVFPYASQLNELIVKHNQYVRVVYFMTWGRRNGDQLNCAKFPKLCTYDGMDDLIRERYIMMAKYDQAMLTPVGSVWRYIRDNKYDIDLYASDGSHPSPIGSYVAAICFYTILFKKDPTQISWNGKKEWSIKEADAELLKLIVKSVVFDDFLKWNIQDNEKSKNDECNESEVCN